MPPADGTPMVRYAGAVATALLVLAAGVASGAGGRPSDRVRHLFVVPAEGDPAVALAKADAREVAGYESFSVVEAEGEDADRLARGGAQRRGDMKTVVIGESLVDPAVDRRPLAAKGDPPGRFTLEFDTDAGGSLALTSIRAFAAVAKRRLVLARRQFSAPSNGQVTMRLRLGRRHRRVLRRVRRMRASLQVQVGALTATKAVKLKAPTRRRKRNR